MDGWLTGGVDWVSRSRSPLRLWVVAEGFRIGVRVVCAIVLPSEPLRQAPISPVRYTSQGSLPLTQTALTSRLLL